MEWQFWRGLRHASIGVYERYRCLSPEQHARLRCCDLSFLSAKTKSSDSHQALKQETVGSSAIVPCLKHPMHFSVGPSAQRFWLSELTRFKNRHRHQVMPEGSFRQRPRSTKEPCRFIGVSSTDMACDRWLFYLHRAVVSFIFPFLVTLTNSTSQVVWSPFGASRETSPFLHT